MIERGYLRGTGSILHIKTKAGMQAALSEFKRAVVQAGACVSRVDLSAITVVERRYGNPFLQVDNEAAWAPTSGGVVEGTSCGSGSVSESSDSPVAVMLPHPLYAEGKGDDEEDGGSGHHGYMNARSEYDQGGDEEGGDVDDRDDDGDDSVEVVVEEEAIEVVYQGDDGELQDLVNCGGYDGGMEDSQPSIGYIESMRDQFPVRVPSSYEPSGRLLVPPPTSTTTSTNTTTGALSAVQSDVHHGRSDVDPMKVFARVYKSVVTMIKAREPDLVRIKSALIDKCGWKKVYSPHIQRNCIFTPWAYHNDTDLAAWKVGQPNRFVLWIDYFYAHCDTQREDRRLLEALQSEYFQNKCAAYITAHGRDSRSAPTAKHCLPITIPHQASEPSISSGLVSSTTSNPATPQPPALEPWSPSSVPVPVSVSATSAMFTAVFCELQRMGWKSLTAIPEKIAHLEKNVDGCPRVFLRPGRNLTDRGMLLNVDYFFSERALLRYLQSILGIDKAGSRDSTDDPGQVRPPTDKPSSLEAIADTNTAEEMAVVSPAEEIRIVEAKKRPSEDMVVVVLPEEEQGDSDVRAKAVLEVGSSDNGCLLAHCLSDVHSDMRTSGGTGGDDVIAEEAIAVPVGSGSVSVNDPDGHCQGPQAHDVAEKIATACSSQRQQDVNLPNYSPLTSLSPVEMVVDGVGRTSSTCDSPGAAQQAVHVVSPLSSERVAQDSTTASLLSQVNPPMIQEEDNGGGGGVRGNSRPAQPYPYPYTLTTPTTTISNTTTTQTDPLAARAMIAEYWKCQKKKFDKGLLLPVIYEDSCLEKVNQAFDRGKISDEDRESLQMEFIQSLSDYYYRTTTTTTTTTTTASTDYSVEVSLRKLLEKLGSMYERRFIGVTVRDSVYLAQLVDFHKQGRITASELQRLQWDFENPLKE